RDLYEFRGAVRHHLPEGRDDTRAQRGLPQRAYHIDRGRHRHRPHDRGHHPVVEALLQGRAAGVRGQGTPALRGAGLDAAPERWLDGGPQLDLAMKHVIPFALLAALAVSCDKEVDTGTLMTNPLDPEDRKSTR